MRHRFKVVVSGCSSRTRIWLYGVGIEYEIVWNRLKHIKKNSRHYNFKIVPKSYKSPSLRFENLKMFYILLHFYFTPPAETTLKLNTSQTLLVPSLMENTVLHTGQLWFLEVSNQSFKHAICMGWQQNPIVAEAFDNESRQIAHIRLSFCEQVIFGSSSSKNSISWLPEWRDGRGGIDGAVAEMPSLRGCTAEGLYGEKLSPRSCWADVIAFGWEKGCNATFMSSFSARSCLVICLTLSEAMMALCLIILLAP